MTRHRKPRRPGLRALAACAALPLVVALGFPAAAYQPPGQTERATVTSGGAEVDTTSWIMTSVSLSADGRYVVFATAAPNLVPGDTNRVEDVFLHDRATGRTTRVSVRSNGGQADDLSTHPVISDDGRFVAFESWASNLVPDDTNGALDIFVRDLAKRKTSRVSVGKGRVQGNGGSWSPSFGADGRYVAFASQSTNLVANDGNLVVDVFVRDRRTRETERVSAGPGGAEADEYSWAPSMSANGRFVAFETRAALVSADNNSMTDVYIRDLLRDTTELVSVAPDGRVGDDPSYSPSVSASGRFVAFDSRASNFVPADTNGSTDVFVRDRKTRSTSRVSVRSDSAQANDFSAFPAISATGRYVAFYSAATDMVPADTNEAEDVFVHDRRTGATERISVAPGGAQANGQSFNAAIAAGGRRVGFVSTATNLARGDGNGTWDVFVRDRGAPFGVGDLVATRKGSRLEVLGWVRASGHDLSRAHDEVGDSASAEAGTDIVEATLLTRPEERDLLVRLDLESFPQSAGAGPPTLLYGLSFRVGGIRYEVRARPGATAQPEAEAKFTLYRCPGDCTERGRASGGIGTSGSSVQMSVPLAALGAISGTKVRSIRAFVDVGDPDAGGVATADEVTLPNGTIRLPAVSLGIAPAVAARSAVKFTVAGKLSNGRLSGNLDLSRLEAGRYKVWTRTCLGSVCRFTSSRIAIA